LRPGDFVLVTPVKGEPVCLVPMRKDLVFGQLWVPADKAKVRSGRQLFDRQLLSALWRSREPDPHVLSSLNLRPGDFVEVGDTCLVPVSSTIAHLCQASEGWC